MKIIIYCKCLYIYEVSSSSSLLRFLITRLPLSNVPRDIRPSNCLILFTEFKLKNGGSTVNYKKKGYNYNIVNVSNIMNTYLYVCLYVYTCLHAYTHV